MPAHRPPFACVIFVAIPAMLSLVQGLSADEAATTDAEVRAAITRSLPFIEANGNAWINEKKCVSCHRVGMMTWTFTEAVRAGSPSSVTTSISGSTGR